MDVREVNNAICREWQTTIEGYKRMEHPTKPQLDLIVKRAKENLAALENAAMAEPDKYVQNTLIYGNCVEIVDCVEDLDCYESKEGEWKRVSFPVKRSDLKLSGQSESWEEKRKRFQDCIEQEYLGMNEADVALRAELEAQEAKIQAELDELKNEKKSKGFFNFAEKGEVKERMKPVKEQLSAVQAQIRSIDKRIEDYCDERVEELGKSYVILSF